MLAGALGIALACDLIIAKDGAGFGTPEINVGLFPFMIMALIYRNVPRKKTTEMLLLGERLTAEEAREAGIVNKVVPAEEFDAAVAEWAAKLASKSPLIMRLGKDAMWRQLDMPLADALDYLRSQLTIELSTEDAIEGVTAFFEKREPEWKGQMSEATEAEKVAAAAKEAEAPEAPPATSGKLKELTDDLHARREKAKLGGGEEKIAKQHAAGQAHRARADRPARRPGHLRRDGHPRRARTSRSGRWTARRRRPTA